MRRKELWLVEKNHATVKSDSSVASRVEWKLTAKAELNCEIYKSWRKYFVTAEQPCEPKSFDVALKIARVEKVPSQGRI